MKVRVKNLGPLREADFELGDLSIVCGKNNTGKTYATYALFGFLSLWRESIVIRVPNEKLEQLLNDGTTTLDLGSYKGNIARTLSQGCRNYSMRLPYVFASSPRHFVNSSFQVNLSNAELDANPSFEENIGAIRRIQFSISKPQDSDLVTITLLVEKRRMSIPTSNIHRSISNAIKDILFGHIFPHPFIASAERTGAAIFRKDLNFARNRILENLHSVEKDADAQDLLDLAHPDYALPVRSNVDFTRIIEDVAKDESFILRTHPEILQAFSDIIGGEYSVKRNDQLYYVPKDKKVKLTMDESSSAVRSLLDIGFYLRHVAKQGDLLMIDEPELNLHPENQRRMARLFAQLVNTGIKVFITTHSDYIIKELSTLIILQQNKPHHKRIATEVGYNKLELLSKSQVKVYIAEEGKVMLEGGKNRVTCQTLTPAKITQEYGIEAPSFDSTIDEMNRIQEELIWGGDES